MYIIRKDGEWNRTWFPSTYPRDRREVLQLADTFEKMLQEVQYESEPAAQLDKEQRVYDIVLNEVIRQVYVECFDRGVILEKVSNKYRELFSRVPQLVSSMKQVIEILIDHLIRRNEIAYEKRINR